jgi:hypothetical protein
MDANTSLIFQIIASVSIGSFFGVLGNKLIAVNYKTNWKWGFYLLAIASFVAGIYNITLLDSVSKLIDYFIMILLLISGIGIFIFTKVFLDKKYVFKTLELHSVINNFTEDADRSDIKLFGGDLNFLGNTPSEMDQNVQYIFLKSSNFRKILILCEEPPNSATMIRYGKILNDLPEVEFRFYNPKDADLRLRGRMKKIQGVEKLLIFFKIGSCKYQVIETDTANSNGALYNNIWSLIWSLAKKLETTQKTEYLRILKG